MRQSFANYTLALLITPLFCATLCSQQAVSVETEDPQVQANAAEAIRRQQYAIAKRLIEHFPNDFDAWRVMGFVHSSHGNREEMLRCWQKCRQLAPDRPDVYDQLARHALQAEEYETAIKLWKITLRLDNDFPGAEQQIGQAYVQSGNAEKAVEALRRQLQQTPESAETYFLLGECYYQLENFAAARESFLKTVQLQPTHTGAHYGLIKTCTRLGRQEEAARHAATFQALEEAASQADLEVRRAYDDTAEMRHRLALTYVDAGRVYATHQRDDAAKEYWNRAIRADPSLESARELLLDRYLQRKDLPNAIEQLKALVKLNPKQAEHWEQLGFLYARAGNQPAAESALKQSIQRQPDRADGYRALAKFYLNTRSELPTAVKLAQRAVKLDATADSYFVLGWAQATVGRVPEARLHLQKAVSLQPGNPMYQKLYEMVLDAKPANNNN